jgi:DNA-binding SARP family transcriptional activator
VEVNVLGSIEVRHGDARLDLGTRKQRALLAALALHRGRAVHVDTLVDLLWGEGAPPAVSASLQSYVAGLRRCLEPDRAPRAPATVLVTNGAGYALQVPADALDAARFERDVTQVHRTLGGGHVPAGTLGDCVARLDAALDGWRGTPYLELEEVPDATAERTRLDELRQLALEDRAVAELALGRHATVASQLESLTAAHPLRERLWALRALALARSHRQADALDVLRQVRELLADELGLEPGAKLRELQDRVLRQDPALEWVPPPEDSPVAAATRPARPRPGSAPLVGRDQELAALADLLDEAMRGTPLVAAVTGDPGIGKSRLAAELAAVAAEHGMTVATGQCSQDDGAPPLWPRAAVLQELGLELPVDETDEDEGAQFRSWEAVVRMVVESARTAPLLVVLEDLHWADEPSLRVLRLLLETARSAPLLVLATWRSLPAPAGALGDVAEGVARRQGLRIELAGLQVDEAADVVESVTRQRPSAEQAQALAARTDGNPFFLVEYARLAGAPDRLDELLAEPDPPTAVHDVLVRRIARLPQGTAVLLRTAAVVGRAFDVATLAAVGDVAADDLLDRLEPAREAGLVREEGIDRWSFSHALVRDTLYAGLSASRRARLHARVAAAMERPGLETERAWHWLAAGPVAAAEAWRSAVRAAEVVRRMHAHERVAELLGAALRAMDDDPSATRLDRYDVLMRLVDVHRWTGRLPELVECEVAAIEVAGALGDVEREARAAASMTLGLWHSADFGEVHEQVVSALRRCLDRLPTEDSAVRCTTLLGLANEQYFGTALAERESLVDEALAMARRLGDDELLLDALLVAHVALSQPASAERLLRHTAEALELATVLGNERGVVVAAVLLAVNQAELGQVPQMRETISLALREATRLRHQYALVILAALEVPWLVMAGRFDECEDRMSRMQRLMDLMGGAADEDDLLTRVSLALWRGGSADVADQVADLDGGPIPVSAIAVVCLLRAGAPARARAYAAEHPLAIDPDRQRDTWLSLMVWCHTAEAALGLGDAGLAADAYAVLEPYAGRSSGGGAHNAMGPVDAFLALAAAACGDLRLAAAHAEDATALMRAWDIPLALAWFTGLRQRHGF